MLDLNKYKGKRVAFGKRIIDFSKPLTDAEKRFLEAMQGVQPGAAQLPQTIESLPPAPKQGKKLDISE